MERRGADVAIVALAALAVAVPLAWAAATQPLVVLVLPAAVGVALVLLHPTALLLGLVAVLPWEDALASADSVITPLKVIALVLLAGWILATAAGRPITPVGPAILWATGVGFAVGLSLLASPDLAIGLADASRYASFIVFAFLVVQLATTWDVLRAIVRVLVLSSTVAAMAGIVSVVVSGELRAGGPIEDPNDFAFLLVAVLPLAGWLVMSEPRLAPLWGASVVLMLVAVGATLSRGAFVGMAAIAIWGAATRRFPRRLWRLAVGTFVVTGALVVALWRTSLSARLEAKDLVANANADLRLGLWRAALEMAGRRPLTGVGPGRFAELADRYLVEDPLGVEAPVAHSTYFHVLAELGVIGAVALGGMFVATMILLVRARSRAAAPQRGLVTALQASLVGALATGAFLSVHLASTFWLLAALATAVAAITAPRVAVTRPAAAGAAHLVST